MLKAFFLASSFLFRLDPTSVSEHFAFYELYPDTKEGKQALDHAWQLLSHQETNVKKRTLPEIDLQQLLNIVNPVEKKELPYLEKTVQECIDTLGRDFGNRTLKGHFVQNVEELYSLAPEEIDLARALILLETNNDLEKVKSYEASIDLMALQIRARLSQAPTDLEILEKINHYIFYEKRFRFPPHSLHAKDIDLYTFLPSVIDSRRGVCLGVSILYLCIAQRLHLPLEIITPPGHIFVRYNKEKLINIETTMRGVDVPSEKYLGIETKELQVRDMKEVVGLAFMNQAAVAWQRKEYEKAIEYYEIAEPFLQGDYLLQMFLGFNLLFTNNLEKGKKLLRSIQDHIPSYAISKDTITEDYLQKKMDPEAIKIIYEEVSQSRASIIEKQKKLKEITKKFPKFRAGWFHLAITYLQLGKEKEALPILEKYIALYPEDPTALYYLSQITFQRKDYNKSFAHLTQAKKILQKKNHFPEAIKELEWALLTKTAPPL